MESIYTQTKVSGQGSLELALIIKKKERKKERKNEKWLFFKHLVLTYTIVLINDFGLGDTEFAGDSDSHS